MAADWSDALRAICRERQRIDYSVTLCGLEYCEQDGRLPCDRCLGYEEARSQSQALALGAMDTRHAGLLIGSMLPEEG